ncbi:uncharacterized protein LOC144119678 [Amblyomma americanum]
MASEVTPQSAAESSKRSTPVLAGDASKKSSTTQEAEGERKERGFQECIEFLMPVYLLPFVFGDKSGTCIYCVLLTVVGLMGRLLPSPAAAMLPIVILPLGGVTGVDQLAAHYLGPRVLSASLLFALAFIGDETTIFFRLCLYALERYALRMEPLFVGMQWLIFGLSLILPSTLIVVFSAVFIERFVTTVHSEIMETDQRIGLRYRTGSSCCDGGRRTRWSRRTSTSPNGRRSRSVSVVSETGTAASGASGFSSLVRQYRIHPDVSEMKQLDELLAAHKAQRGPRKTSFGIIQRPPLDDDQPHYLPVRRIRSFSLDYKQPSSILKHNPDPAQLIPSPSSVPPSADVTETEDRRGTFSMGYPHTSSAEGSLTAEEGPISIMPAAPSEVPAEISPPSTSITSPEAKPSSAAGPLPTAAPTSQEPNLSSVAAAGLPMPPAKCTADKVRSPSARKPRAKAKSTHNQAGRRDASARKRSDKAEAQNDLQTKSTNGAPQPMQPAEQPGTSNAEAKRTAPRQSASKKKTVPEPNAKAKCDPVPVPKPVLKQQPKAETKPDARVKPGPEQRPEVRGVLKKTNPPLQPSIGSHSGSVTGRKPLQLLDNDVWWNFDSWMAGRYELAGASSDLNWAEQRKLLTRQASSTSEHQAPSTSWLTGAEQQTSSYRVRALTVAARSAFLAGAAYTAILGNIASFSTLPTRNTVLVTLGCDEDVCPVNWLSWTAVSLPVALICCMIFWTSIYCANIVSFEDDVDEQTQEDMSKSARICHDNMKRHTARETLVFVTIMGTSLASSAYSLHYPEWGLEVPLLGLTVLVLSVLPGSILRHCWSHRVFSWRSLCSRMPWSIILTLGSVMALSWTIEAWRLVESCMARLGDQFWAQRSTKSSQFILLSVAAVLSELVFGESLARSMATTVLRVAVVTETPASFYVVPVCLAASINLVLPVSLPLLVMRQYFHAKSGQMVAYGVFLKCVAVTAIFISMNTIGLIVFQSEPVAKAQPMGALHNTTGFESGVL